MCCLANFVFSYLLWVYFWVHFLHKYEYKTRLQQLFCRYFAFFYCFSLRETTQFDFFFVFKVCSGSIDYYAQELSPKQRQDFLFYGVQENILSLDSCAKFCYETEFCRSAAYDVTKKRCELAYASVVRCNTEYKNKSTFQPSSNKIIAIYCIDCPSGNVVFNDGLYGLNVSKSSALSELFRILLLLIEQLQLFRLWR